MKSIIITTINSPSKAIEKYSALSDWNVIVVGDKKTPDVKFKGVDFISLSEQNESCFYSTETTPENHYARKNIGYLYALSKNTDIIFDTDDDTFPYDGFKEMEFWCNKSVYGSKFINYFTLFTDKPVWPRGLDLSHIQNNKSSVQSCYKKVGVWQSLINNDSDFDAIYRLIDNKLVTFDRDKEYSIESNFYCPFNSQNTFWNKQFFPLLYIPAFVSFRFSDILRGYIAQRIMWDYGHHVGVCSPLTYQVRNPHNYFSDFLDEIEMYTNVPKVIQILDQLKLPNKNLLDDLVFVYHSLLEHSIVNDAEIENVHNWRRDVDILLNNNIL